MSFSVVSASASFLASSSHRSAINIALETESICIAEIRVSFLRALESELVANLRAMPMWPCASAATCKARLWLMPSLDTRRSATVLLDGCLRATLLTLERIVGSMSASDGAQRIQIVPAGGSSKVLRRTLEERSAIRSASSMIMI